MSAVTLAPPPDRVLWEEAAAALRAELAQWEEEEAAVLAELTAEIADRIWAAQKAEQTLLSRIREVTGGRMLRPGSADTAQDWRESVPAHYRRMRHGVPADEVAAELGFESEAALLAACRAEAGHLYHTHADAWAAAEWQAAQDPRYLAWLAEHRPEREALEAELAAVEAWLAEHAPSVAPSVWAVAAKEGGPDGPESPAQVTDSKQCTSRDRRPAAICVPRLADPAVPDRRGGPACMVRDPSRPRRDPRAADPAGPGPGSCPRCGRPVPDPDAVCCPACGWLLTAPGPQARADAAVPNGAPEPVPPPPADPAAPHPVYTGGPVREWPSRRLTRAIVIGTGLLAALGVAGGIGFVAGWLAPQAQIHAALQQLDPGLYVHNVRPPAPTPPRDSAPAATPAPVSGQPARVTPSPASAPTPAGPPGPPRGWQVIHVSAWPAPPAQWAQWEAAHLTLPVHPARDGAWVAQGTIPGTHQALWLEAVPAGTGSRLLWATPAAGSP